MAKKLTLFCVFLLCMAGLKAQTYCYHCYKKYDKFDVPEPQDKYVYITFKGDLIYFSEKDGSYPKDYKGKPIDVLYKFYGYSDDAAVYHLWLRGWNKEYYYHDANYLLVSKDKTLINYHFKGSELVEQHTLCYEKCPDGDCEKPHVPAMKH